MAIIKAPQDPQARKAWLTALRELQRRKQPVCSLSDFVKYMWPVIEPGTDLVWNWHMDAVCAHLEAVAFGVIKNLIINVPPGTSKPCSVDGHVLERTRGRIRLGDVGVGDEVLTHKGRYRRVSAVHQQGVLPRLEIQTHMGRAVRVADDHSVLTTRGWIQAKDLTEADSTAVVHPREDCGTRTIPLEEARLLGYLIGDGCVKYGGARFTNQDSESVADFEACAAALGFGLSKAKKAGGTADTYDVKLRSKAPGTRTSIVSDFLTKHDLAGRCSYDKRVPPAVLAGRADIVADFIAAYWACDGTIHDRRDLPRSGRPGQLSQVIRLEAVTVSAELAHDLQHLFSRLGMRMRVRRKTTQLKTRAQGDTYSAWHVVAEDQDTVAKFMQYIAPRMRHEKRTRAQGTVRRDFDAVLNPDPVTRVVRIDPGECRCLTVEEDSSFVFDDIAVHNSTIATVMWPTWMWTFNPEWRLVAASYADTLSLRDGAKARVLLESQRYKDAFAPAWRLQGDVNAKGYYQNSKMGFRVSVSVGGAGTGLRGNCVSGSTTVATEHGGIRIADLAAMARPPRVWSSAPDGRLELKEIRAIRIFDACPVLRITTQAGHVLDCTSDHRIYTPEGYTAAAATTSGTGVRVLPHHVLAVRERTAEEVAAERAGAILLARLRASVDGSADARTEREYVRDLLHARVHPEGARHQPERALDARNPPHGRGPEEQSPREPYNAVRDVPHPPPQVQTDTVASVTAVSGIPVAVYDLQVEGNSNFFAEGILVHNCILVDDPLNASESHSKPARDAVKWWWDQGFANRLNDMRTGARVVIMQRLHEEDLTGHLLAQTDPKWDHLCLPSEFDPERRSVTNAQWYIPPGLPGQGTLAQFADPRREKGELLFPARFPIEVLAQERVRLGSSGYSGQHDQNPTAEGGNKFKLEWWRFWKPDGVAAAGAARPRGCNSAPAVPLPERFDDMLISVDCTFKAVSRSKEATAQSDIDFVCASVIGRKGANKYLLDQRHGRWGLKATLNVIRELRNDYPRARRILVEDKANGSAVVETLEEELDGVIAVQPEGGKEARAAACEPQIESGNFYLPEGAPWLPAFLAEFASFPKGKHDDRVDSVTQALVWWINGAKSLARARMMGSW